MARQRSKAGNDNVEVWVRGLRFLRLAVMAGLPMFSRGPDMAQFKLGTDSALRMTTAFNRCTDDFKRLMDVCNKFRRLKVRTNADTPHDCTVARQYGAEGVGLCRTEHMFFKGDRINAVRRMILADTLERRQVRSARPFEKHV